MRLMITTPTAIIVDEANVSALRAEDDSGSFGLLQGHADLLTALKISIVSWRGADDRMHYCAVRRGVLSVTGGDEIAIATREAIVGDDLDRLEGIVLDEFHQRLEAERTARTESLELQMKAIRQIVRYLRPDKPGARDADPRNVDL
ncbi:F0F1 ATP synthase subunit epsilon [Bradyrhizobium sp.]|uniref:F0F1 ATP synthase subunit epsilon n=1 Tax=Bradyrhizobium sp. TaxID=376 RepID=UPI003C6278BE